MVVFGQCGCIWAKVVVLGQSEYIPAKVVVFGQCGCFWAKVVIVWKVNVFGQSGFIREKWFFFW